MDPLLCRASSFSSSSSGKTSDSKHVVSSEEFIIENFDKAIDCWENFQRKDLQNKKARYFEK